jgi:hypothetical protein
VAADPVTLRSLTNLTNEGNEVYAATAAGISNTAQGQIAEASLAGVEAWIECQKPATGDAATVLAFDALRTQQSYGNNDFIAFLSTAGLVQQGVNTTVLTTVYTLPEGAGNRMRLHRSAADVFTIQTTEDNGATWTVRHTFVATPATTQRAHFYTTFSTTPRRMYQVRQSGLVLDILGARFAADGNSQTVGVNGAAVSFPGQIATSLGVTVTNYGVGGQSTLDMIADAATEIDAAFSSAPNILIVGEVRNHLVAMDASADARIAVDALWTYCDGRRAAAAGALRFLRIVVWNVLPAGHTASSIGIVALNALFVEANALIAAEWPAHADAYVDVRSDVRLTDPFDLTYFTDDVHLTTAGDTVMRDLFLPKILALTSDVAFASGVGRKRDRRSRGFLTLLGGRG